VRAADRRGELYGVLNVNDLTGKRLFTEYDLRALGLFAEHAAIAIRNAHAYQRERQMVTRLEEIDRMKTEFIATVSHELRTPLTSIIGCAKTIRRRGDQLGEDQRIEFLQMIERQGERLLHLIEDVLTASRIESGHAASRRERVDLGDLARNVKLAFEAAGAGDRIRIEGRKDISVFADPISMEQLVTNLVENALKYSGDTLPVVIRLDEDPGAVRIEVSDQGPGIPAEVAPSIFDRFRQLDQSTTRRAGGVGLGLYIVKNLVEAHGGAISVTSEAGRGATFTITIPQRRGRAEPDQPAPD
jgi:signal transduction histidine kinase